MRCDHLDAIAVGQLSIQAVTVIGFVADQSCREGVEEAVSEDAFDKLAFVRRSAFDTNGKRKTVIIGESDDFRPLCRVWLGPTARPPFFAPVKEASIKASSSCSFPWACNSRASTRKMRSSLPSRTHCWKRRWRLVANYEPVSELPTSIQNLVFSTAWRIGLIKISLMK